MFHRHVNDTIRSLQTHPDQWVLGSSGYRLINEKAGVSVWIANGIPGMDISKYDRWGHDVVWGGVTGLSSVCLSLDHWRLWLAAKAWRHKHDRLNLFPEDKP